MRIKPAMNFKKLRDSAKVPTLGSKLAAGLDLCASIDSDTGNEQIMPGETKKIATGLAFEIPEGFFGALFARSGLATKQGLRPANCVGVIDADYRGEVIVALHNDSQAPVTICDGDRIAQLVVIPYLGVLLNEVEDLTGTERGANGFGSTGVGEIKPPYVRAGKLPYREE